MRSYAIEVTERRRASALQNRGGTPRIDSSRLGDRAGGFMRLPVKTILVPYDFSEASAMALDTARGCSSRTANCTWCTSSRCMARPACSGTAWMMHRALHRSRRQSPRCSASGESKRPRISSWRRARRERLHGRGEDGRRAVVIPTRGRTGLIRFAMGSVSEQVVRYRRVRSWSFAHPKRPSRRCGSSRCRP